MNLSAYATSSRTSGNGTLSYTIESSDTNVVTGSVTDTLLTLIPVGDGDAEVTVTFSERDLGVDLSFDVIVDEDDDEGFNIDVVRFGAANEEPLSSAIDDAVAHWESILKDIGSMELPIPSDGDVGVLL